MKQIIALLFTLAALSLPAQSYTQSTNLFFTNNIEAGLTLTYTGTNCLDVTRYRSFAIVATGAGTNTSTNTLTFTFLAGSSTTNWEATPSIALVGSNYGIAPFVLFTNINVGDGIGYIKPYQIISAMTNRVTNAWTYGVLKTYPRN